MLMIILLRLHSVDIISYKDKYADFITIDYLQIHK